MKKKTAEKIMGQCFPVKSKVTCKNLAHLEGKNTKKVTYITYAGLGGGGGGISNDGDDQRIFLGLKFSIPGFLGGRKIWQVFFGGSLI